MTGQAKKIWGLVLGLALIQTALLGSMVWDRVHLLRHGREIVLPVVPVDPRDVFRGDYVNLGYPITRIDRALVPAGVDETLKGGDRLYVTLEKDAAGEWQPVKASRKLEPAADLNHVVLKARTTSWWSPPPVSANKSAGPPVSLHYGIESYFVSEGTGHGIEAMVRDKKLKAVIAVDARGNAAIKALLGDGKPIHEEKPL